MNTSLTTNVFVVSGAVTQSPRLVTLDTFVDIGRRVVSENLGSVMRKLLALALAANAAKLDSATVDSPPRAISFHMMLAVHSCLSARTDAAR